MSSSIMPESINIDTNLQNRLEQNRINDLVLAGILSQGVHNHQRFTGKYDIYKRPIYAGKQYLLKKWETVDKNGVKETGKICPKCFNVFKS